MKDLLKVVKLKFSRYLKKKEVYKIKVLENSKRIYKEQENCIRYGREENLVINLKTRKRRQRTQ